MLSEKRPLDAYKERQTSDDISTAGLVTISLSVNCCVKRSLCCYSASGRCQNALQSLTMLTTLVTFPTITLSEKCIMCSLVFLNKLYLIHINIHKENFSVEISLRYFYSEPQ